MNPDDLKKAIDWAKQNPNDPRSKELRKRIESGALDTQLSQSGLKTFGKAPEGGQFSSAPEDITELVPKEKPSRFREFIGDVKEGFSELQRVVPERGRKMTEKFRNIKTPFGGKENLTQLDVAGRTGQAVFGGLAQGLGALIDSGTILGKTIAKAGLNQEQEDTFKRGLENVMANEKVQSVGEAIGRAMEDLKEVDPATYASLEDAGILTEVLGGTSRPVRAGIEASVDASKQGVDVARRGVEQTADFVADNAPTVARQVDSVFRPTEAKLEAKIDRLFTKAVRPTLRGKETIGQMEKGRQQAIDAVRTINENAPKLKYTDELGEVVEGRSPESLREFSQAIDQTKRSIYDEYNSLAKQTGDAGVTINPAAFVDEFDKFINDKAVQTASPETIQYAKTMRDRYGSVGELGPEDIENIIKIYNQDLQTFYRNPTADQGRKVAVDAMVVNNLRKQLDETIAKTTGEEYQALKTKYGALRSIEKDVLNATLRDARKNTAGLIDFTDIFSGGQLAAGVISMNPAMIGSAATQRGIKSYFKYLNDPNKNVERMFNTAETLQSRPEMGFFQRAVSGG